ncbi:histidine phosphatase family protein [Thalassiella azotivora]
MSTAPTLVLVRHGRTEWSAAGRHTGRTDVPLDADGEAQAARLEPLLAGLGIVHVRVSPLQRARRTAELAGLVAPGDARGGEVAVDDDLAEWDYGAFEGLTTPEIRRQEEDPAWQVFAAGVRPGGPGQSPGENVHSVADRARSVLGRVREPLERGPVALVGHGHALRVLTTAWLGLPPDAGAMLELSPGSVSVLSSHHGVATIRSWNHVPATA